MLLRDLMHGGNQVQVVEESGSRSVRQWIALRPSLTPNSEARAVTQPFGLAPAARATGEVSTTARLPHHCCHRCVAAAQPNLGSTYSGPPAQSGCQPFLDVT
jgi:hypothetical protein